MGGGDRALEDSTHSPPTCPCPAPVSPLYKPMKILQGHWLTWDSPILFESKKRLAWVLAIPGFFSQRGAGNTPIPGGQNRERRCVRQPHLVRQLHSTAILLLLSSLGSGGPSGLASPLSSAPAQCKASWPSEGSSALLGVCQFKIKIKESFSYTCVA